MGESRNSFQFKCPFYADKNSETTIRCEGIVPRTKITMMFNSRNAKEYHCRTRCKDVAGMTECPMYKALYAEAEKR